MGWRNGDESDANVDEMSPNGRVVLSTLERRRGVRPRNTRGVDSDDGKANGRASTCFPVVKSCGGSNSFPQQSVSPSSAVGDLMSVIVELAGRIVVQRSF